MKILHVYKNALPESKGGVEVFIDTLCSVTAEYGVKNTVLTLSKQPKKQTIQLHGYDIKQAKQDLFIASTGFSISAFFIFRKLCAQVDIIHYHFPNPFADLLHFCCRVKKPTIVTYHSDIIKQKKLMWLYRPLKRRFLRSVDCIVATSPNYYVSSDVLQSFAEKTSVIPIGIDIKTYPALDPSKSDAWQKRFPKPFFLFIGAMRYYKGLHIALKAIQGTDIKLAIAGISGIETELKKQAENNNPDNISFLGFISDEDKIALLNLCHGFVFPSHLRSEAFGISLLEAAAYGKPLISCEIGTGTSYVNIHNETGLVVTPTSVDELRDAMQELLDDPEKATRLGLNAQKRANQLFTAEKQARAYCDLYQKLLTR